MARVLVGTFPSREAAEAAHAALESEGLRPASRETRGDPPGEHTSLESIIANVFSGLVPPPRFAERLRRDRERGAWTLAIRGLDAERGERARATLARSGDAEWFDEDADAASGTSASEVALFGPDIALLPNAASGWREAWTSTASRVRSAGVDPARPRGLIEDVAGLSPAGAARVATDRAPNADTGGPPANERAR